jgi:thiaminase
MPFESDKIMFEIYKESTYSGQFRVVYFTELQDHNKEHEISRALAGEHFYDGFIRNYRKEQAKEAIQKLLERLNNGESLNPDDVARELKPYAPA